MPDDAAIHPSDPPDGGGHRSGFVTLVGRPNTGKSTLINALVGRKVAIVTPHPQTTRTHLLGVCNLPPRGERPGGQIVFVDTPGAHRGHGQLSREMLRSIRAGLEGRDLTLFLADVTRPFGAEDQLALELLGGGNERGENERGERREERGEKAAPAFLLLNKVDCLPRRDDILPIIAAFRERFPFAEIVPISALRRYNLESLLDLILRYLPLGPEYFPPGQNTDQPEHFVISEIIRERAMLATKAEVPHTLAVKIESDHTRGGESQSGSGAPLRVVQAVLHCERPGQKAILIGRGGATIRRIGTEARAQLEAAFGVRFYLELRVLVRGEWREDPRAVADLDFRRE